MISTLRHDGLLSNVAFKFNLRRYTSAPKYDEMPRGKWMFEQSAQNTITVSRMIFTQEINEAFEQLEEGNDNAMKDIWQKQVDQIAGLIEAGAYTRPSVSSTWAISDTKYTLNTPSYPPIPPEHPLNNPSMHPLFHGNSLR
jgi:hypothetical protein